MKNAGAALLRAVLTSVVVVGVVAALLFAAVPHFRISSTPFLEVARYLPNTLVLLAASVLIALLLAVPYALIMRRNNNSPVGRVVLTVMFPLCRIPVFWLALALQLVLAVHGRFPTAGMFGSDKFSAADLVAHLVLPASALALFQAGAYMLWLRSGAPAGALLAQFAEFLPSILSAAVLVETIYAWPGEGRLFFQAAVSEPKASFFFAFFVMNGVLVVVVRELAAAFGTPGCSASALPLVEGL